MSQSRTTVGSRTSRRSSVRPESMMNVNDVPQYDNGYGHAEPRQEISIDAQPPLPLTLRRDTSRGKTTNPRGRSTVDTTSHSRRTVGQVGSQSPRIRQPLFRPNSETVSHGFPEGGSSVHVNRSTSLGMGKYVNRKLPPLPKRLPIITEEDKKAQRRDPERHRGRAQYQSRGRGRTYTYTIRHDSEEQQTPRLPRKPTSLDLVNWHLDHEGGDKVSKFRPDLYETPAFRHEYEAAANGIQRMESGLARRRRQATARKQMLRGGRAGKKARQWSSYDEANAPSAWETTDDEQDRKKGKKASRRARDGRRRRRAGSLCNVM